MRPKLSAYRTVLIRVSADAPDSTDQEREAERRVDQALDATLEEIRAFAASRLVDLGQVSITTS